MLSALRANFLDLIRYRTKEHDIEVAIAAFTQLLEAPDPDHIDPDRLKFGHVSQEFEPSHLGVWGRSIGTEVRGESVPISLGAHFTTEQILAEAKRQSNELQGYTLEPATVYELVAYAHRQWRQDGMFNTATLGARRWHLHDGRGVPQVYLYQREANLGVRHYDGRWCYEHLLFTKVPAAG